MLCLGKEDLTINMELEIYVNIKVMLGKPVLSRFPAEVFEFLDKRQTYN